MKSKAKKQVEEWDEEARLTPIEATLLRTRTVFLTEEIDSDVISDLMATIIALDQRNVAPINMFINSPGGEIMAGLALIDLMDMIKSPVNTIVMGEACSMAGIISICGKTRSISKNSVIMFHEGFFSTQDYSQKMKCRAVFFDKLEERMDIIIKQKTKLTDKDIETMKNGELWLFAQDAVIKGVADKII
jgi:ATP-dependent Clp protease protease subunit